MNYGVILSELEGSGSQYVMVFDTVRSIIAIQNADIQAIVAIGEVAANVPNVSPSINTQIQGKVATATMQSIPGTVSPIRNVSIITPVTTGIIKANSPVVSPEFVILNANIQAVLAIATMQAITPIIGETTSARINAIAAMVNAQVVIPKISPVRNAVIVSKVANATIKAIPILIPSIDLHETSSYTYRELPNQYNFKEILNPYNSKEIANQYVWKELS